MRKTLCLVLAAAAVAGCASLNTLSSDVATFSQWPAERKPATYAFDRLPSQQAQPERQQRLEDAARRGLEAAGFQAAPDPKEADVTVQLGARVSANERSPFDDPFWWRGGLIYVRHGVVWRDPWWGVPYTPSTYEREVAVLIRDRKTGTPLYEARASNDGSSPSIAALLPAMFEAALKDFPAGGPNPRRVTTAIAP
jgi:hypothetical protein